jgi:hypothetical protein
VIAGLREAGGQPELENIDAERPLALIELNERAPDVVHVGV